MNPETSFAPIARQQWIMHMIFVRIPKNASTSIYEHLGPFNLVHKHRKLFMENLKHPLYRGVFDPTHAKPHEIKKILPVNPDNYFSFTVMRNPWDRFVSMFTFTNKMELWRLFNLTQPPTFEEFCEIAEDKMNFGSTDFFPTQNQSQWLTGGFQINQILAFENLKEEFASMVESRGIEHIRPNLPHLNSTHRKEYKKYYNSYTQGLVSTIFSDDISLFDYSF